MSLKLFGINDAAVVRRIHSADPELFELIADLGAVLRKSVFPLNLILPVNAKETDTETKRKILAACMLMKATNTFESMILLAERGFQSDARVLLRALFETTIRLVAVCKIEEYWEKYIGYDWADRIIMLETCVRHEDFFLDTLSPEEGGYSREKAEEIIGELKKMIKEKGIPGNSTYFIAEKVGMIADYDFIYRHLSIDVHCTPKSIERYLETRGDKVIAIQPRPYDTSSLSVELYCGLDYYSRGINSWTGTFGARNPEVLKEYVYKVTAYHRRKEVEEASSEKK